VRLAGGLAGLAGGLDALTLVGPTQYGAPLRQVIRVPLVSIKVRDLPDGVSPHRFELPADWVAEQLSGVEDVHGVRAAGTLVLEATRRGREVLLNGAAEAQLVVACVRCLAEFELHVEAPLAVLMRPGPEGQSRADELCLEDLGEERYAGDEIVLDDLVRDLLILEVPMNPSCGAGCPGWHGLTGDPRGD
jgi:uncharacterized metal-binding protein YceD (DUF177 family)